MSTTTDTTTTDGIAMDHVALASRHAWDHIIRFCYQMGAHWLGGPPLGDGGFYFCQAEMQSGTKLEFLEPIEGAGSDFLRRFLDRNGPGPHHFTFKVKDFDAALDAVAAAGYDLVSVDRSDPEWQEAFLHPKQSHGIVIQLAHNGGDGEGWTIDTELPPPLRPALPVLSSVDHLVADLEAAVKLFSGPLTMSVLEHGSDADGNHVIVGSGPWRLKLIQPTNPSWRHWLGARPGRLLRLCFELDEPGTVPDARAVGDGRYEISPERNLGTRLLLSEPGHR